MNTDLAIIRQALEHYQYADDGAVRFVKGFAAKHDDIDPNSPARQALEALARIEGTEAAVSDLTLAQLINAAIRSVYPKMRLRYGDLNRAIIKALRPYLVNPKPMDMEALRVKIEGLAPMLAEKVIEMVKDA